MIIMQTKEKNYQMTFDGVLFWRKRGGEASKIPKLAWIFPHPLFNYELPKKAEEVDGKNWQVVPQELFLQRQPTDRK